MLKLYYYGVSLIRKLQNNTTIFSMVFFFVLLGLLKYYMHLKLKFHIHSFLIKLVQTLFNLNCIHYFILF